MTEWELHEQHMDSDWNEFLAYFKVTRGEPVEEINT
jgi:hypothetical protein